MNQHAHRMTVSGSYVAGHLTVDLPVASVASIFDTSTASILRRFSLRMMSKTESMTNEMFDVSVAHVAWQYTCRCSPLAAGLASLRKRVLMKSMHAS